MNKVTAKKVALIDLDTSHPARFVPLLRAGGYDITGIYDSGDVHPQQVVVNFGQKHGISRIFESLEEAVEHCDIAFIMGADWDQHLHRANPFREAGKALFIDKPFAGNLRDLQEWEQWANEGVRISGGSSLWYTRELTAFKAMPFEQCGQLHTLFGGCAVDDFNYGIHAFSHALSYLPSSVKGVRFLGRGIQRLIEIVCHDGCRVLLSVGSQKGGLPFHLSLVSDLKVVQVVVDNQYIYQSLIEQVMPYLAGETEHAPIPLSHLLQAERSALLALASERDGGIWKWMQTDNLDPVSYNGNEFCRVYRETRYPKT